MESNLYLNMDNRLISKILEMLIMLSNRVTTEIKSFPIENRTRILMSKFPVEKSAIDVRDVKGFVGKVCAVVEEAFELICDLYRERQTTLPNANDIHSFSGDYSQQSNS